MTPQAIAELVAEMIASLGDRVHDIDPVELRREAARGLFESLRRTEELTDLPGEPPQLRRHPDIPESGMWMRAVRRDRHLEEPVTVVWHSFDGTYRVGAGGLVVLHSLCPRDQRIWESDAGTRVYVTYQRAQPEDACRLCLRRLEQISRER